MAAVLSQNEIQERLEGRILLCILISWDLILLFYSGRRARKNARVELGPLNAGEAWILRWQKDG